jgi:hypothetical protein
VSETADEKNSIDDDNFHLLFKLKLNKKIYMSSLVGFVCFSEIFAKKSSAHVDQKHFMKTKIRNRIFLYFFNFWHLKSPLDIKLLLFNLSDLIFNQEIALKSSPTRLIKIIPVFNFFN